MEPNVDLNLFRVFAAIYRCGSLTQAAAQLHITQPAVSSALARLRAALDDALFVREGQRMVPTTFARTLAPRILSALEQLQESARPPAAFDPQLSTQRFVLGMREALEFSLLVPLIQLLRQEAPGVKVHSVPLERRLVERQLLSGELDFAVDVPLAVGENIDQQLLSRDELCLAVRAGHPLLHGKRSLERWLGADHVVVSGRSSGPVLEDLALQRQGLRREVSVRCQNYYAACHLVAQSELVLVIPRSFGEWFATQLPLRLAKLPFEAPTLDIMLYWNRNNERLPGHRWFREVAVRLAGAR